MVIVRPVADRQIVIAVSDEAAAFGIRRGMTLTQARALCAQVRHADHDPARDARALEALARWLMRFSPVVALGEGEETHPVTRASRPCERSGTGGTPVSQGGIFLDLTGSQRLFGGTESIVHQVRQSLDRFQISARLAVAPTAGAAWALTFSAVDGVIVPPELLESAVAPLPPAALRISDDVADALHHLGLVTIGHVMHLPREVLPARFGADLLRRIDQAMGFIPEPLVPLEYREPVAARMDFDGVVGSLEAIWLAFQKLIGQVIAQLERRGCGARRVEVELLRAYAPPVRKEILLSRPSRNPVNLFNLFRCALEEMELPLKAKRPSRLRARPPGTPRHVVRTIDDGFTGLRIAVPLVEKITDQQIALLDHEQYAGQEELDRLIDRLRVRLGDSSIMQARLVESYAPEHAWRETGADETPCSATTGSATCREGRASVDRMEARPFGHVAERMLSDIEFHPVRPLRLLPRPVEVRVMVSPSDDAEGVPVAFAHESAVHRVAHVVGPERIAGRWWDGNDKTRDYFDVVDPNGMRFWVFRIAQTGKWFLHGMFE